MTHAIQIAMAFLGSLGFAVMFHVKGIKLFFCGLGGAVTWAIFLGVKIFGDSIIGGFFIATLSASLISEILARKIKAPVIMFLVPMLVPLIPGSDLYYTTSHLINNRMQEFGSGLTLLLQKVGAMAFGIILMASFVQIFLYGKQSFLKGLMRLKKKT
ncbi:threonine/serine exporter family protein [Alkalibacter mobilis]|uniref:threonine/serine exporter family protein n=1 Tax=Alkalibacter mobilis TaxID=2787712 RepID=UPI00189D0A2B|nr:threonine/serine exporter family protein [Alkalibacter mobilis]MBF7096252.1 threonine/serine exporter family protein [Alkalibacter mobilis]